MGRIRPGSTDPIGLRSTLFTITTAFAFLRLRAFPVGTAVFCLLGCSDTGASVPADSAPGTDATEPSAGDQSGVEASQEEPADVPASAPDPNDDDTGPTDPAVEDDDTGPTEPAPEDDEPPLESDPLTDEDAGTQTVTMGPDPAPVTEPTDPSPADVDLATSTGCAGVYNPDQVLVYDLTLAPADWESLLADDSYALDFQAELSCGGQSPLVVGVQRKRSGGAEKVGFKVDTNLYVEEQEFHGLRKLVFENGVSSGSTVDDADVGVLVSEYLGWQVMNLAGVISSRAAIAGVRINGGPTLAYVNVENVDKRFLQARLGDDEGWLYKKSGGDGDGLKTHESDGVENPHEGFFCFWAGRGTGCAVPAADELATALPPRLDIEQMLRLGAANALMGNTDSPLPKDNNYFYYDSPAGVRTYLPWDLDTTMRSSFDVVTGTVPGGTPMFTDALFSNWQGEYVAIVAELVTERVTESVMSTELERVETAAAAILDGDPYLADDTASATSALKRWWATRLVEVAGQVAP